MFDTTEGTTVSELFSPLQVQADVVTRDGGAVLATSDVRGHPALRFPPFSPAPDPPRAVVRLTPDADAGADPLSPGTADFTFGADFAVDPTSQGTEVDSGNNILQRGLASDPSQFKVEVDELRPLCRIRGAEGLVQLRAKKEIRPDQWYRVRCSRAGTAVKLTIYRVSSNVPTVVEEVREESPTGELSWQTRPPMSVGGKLAANGSMIRSQTDQFNGVIALPMLQIGSG